MSKEARSVLGLSDGGDSGKEHVHVPAEKNSKEALKKQSGNLNDARNLAASALGEHGSHVPANKLKVGGTAGGSEGGAKAAGNPKNADRKNLGKVQRAALENHERRENSGEDTSKKDVYGRKK
jgi:hypothetical protein